jgi:hypothetical protein
MQFMSRSKWLTQCALALVAIATTLALAPSAASAADSIDGFCRVSIPGTTSCKTDHTVHANRTTHDLEYEACAPGGHYADWQVKDNNNGVIVKQGRVNAGQCTIGYIYGLYGSYWAWVFNTRTGATMYINGKY